MSAPGHVHDGDYWALAIELITECAEMVRGAINSASAGTVTEDAGMDMGHAVLELLALYYNFELDHILMDLAPPTGADWVLNKVQIGRCFSIVFWLLVFFTALEYLAGFEAPNNGDEFVTGKSEFDDIYEILLAAKADGWKGDGAGAYNAKNEALYGLIATMRDADQQIAQIMQRQAEQVQTLREEIASILAALVVLLLAIALYMKLYWIPRNVAETENECTDAACITPACQENARVAFFSTLPGSCYVPPNVANATTVIDAAATTIQAAPPPSPASPTNWLPPLVAGVAIVATCAAIACVGLLIDNGKTNAKDLKKQTERYQQAAQAAADLVGSQEDRDAAPKLPAERELVARFEPERRNSFTLAAGPPRGASPGALRGAVRRADGVADRSEAVFMQPAGDAVVYVLGPQAAAVDKAGVALNQRGTRGDALPGVISGLDPADADQHQSVADARVEPAQYFGRAFCHRGPGDAAGTQPVDTRGGQAVARDGGVGGHDPGQAELDGQIGDRIEVGVADVGGDLHQHRRGGLREYSREDGA